MNQEALKNIVTQAEEAITERRLLDAVALTETILRDIDSDMPLKTTPKIREFYEAMLHYFSQGGTDLRLEFNLKQLFQAAITELQNAVVMWQTAKGTTTYGRLAKSFCKDEGFTTDDMLDQLHRTARSRLGKPAYHEALDAAFSFLWVLPIPKDTYAKLLAAIDKLDDFAVQTLIAGTMLGTLEVFCPTRLRLLVALAQSKTDTPVRPRALISLFLVYTRWQHFIAFYPDIEADIRKLFTEDVGSEDIAAMSDSLIREQLTPRVAEKSDELLPKITKMIEKQVKWMGEHEDEKATDKAGKTDMPDFLVNIMRIDPEDNKLFDTLSQHARRIDMLRASGFDINASNFTYMKRFSFFDHVAHYFYPFSTQVPAIANILSNLKSKAMTFQIMTHSHFCSSDVYSYLLMMDFVESKSNSLKNILDEHMDELEEMVSDGSEVNDYVSDLDPYTDYAQTIQRFINSPNHKGQRPDPFQLNSDNLPPLQPVLRNAFRDYAAVEPSVNALLGMNAHTEAMAIITWAQETFGATAALLRSKGKALMNLQMWNRAIEALSQAQLLDEDPDTAHLLAQCHEALGAWQAALAQLQTVEAATEQLDPNLATEIVLCLIQSGQWDDAANRLFQLEFEGHTSKTIKRSIGWCSLHQGKYARAEQYYNALIADTRKPSWQDLLNLGHAQWLQGNRAQAIQTYHNFTKAFNRSKNKQSFSSWQEAFADDANALLAPTTPKAEIAVLTDAISML